VRRVGFEIRGIGLIIGLIILFVDHFHSYELKQPLGSCDYLSSGVAWVGGFWEDLHFALYSQTINVKICYAWFFLHTF
jgi:hypothetical protein